MAILLPSDSQFTAQAFYSVVLTTMQNYLICKGLKKKESRWRLQLCNERPALFIGVKRWDFDHRRPPSCPFGPIIHADTSECLAQKKICTLAICAPTSKGYTQVFLPYQNTCAYFFSNQHKVDCVIFSPSYIFFAGHFGIAKMALQYFEIYILHTYPFQVLTQTESFLKTGSPSTYDCNGACPLWL
uniref:Uncharacterized protein n=1 Tax=Micrurus carvalhoi TaxID=3147026 RepID=A0A2H6NAZ4_9SAUR